MSGIKISRRSFLKVVPAGLLGALSIGYLGGRLFSKKSTTQQNTFSKNSIFAPRDKQI